MIFISRKNHLLTPIGRSFLYRGNSWFQIGLFYRKTEIISYRIKYMPQDEVGRLGLRICKEKMTS